MKKQINKLSLAIKTTIFGLTSSTLLVVQPVFAQDPVDSASDAGRLEEVFITGTRIKRTEYQEGTQVIEIDREKIDALGSLIIADVLRSSPLNAYGSFSERSGSSAQSNATINLRGLGDERTLVMIDGRRMVGSPNMGASVTNINMIPMSAVERVDILADGASAVYGSDAVAGVVNMQMRKDFEGLEFNIRHGERSNDDGSEYGMSLLGGVTGDKGNITFAIEKNHRSPIFDRDREYTASWTRDNNGNGIIDAYVDTDGYSLYGASIWLFDPVTEYDVIQAATSCQEGDGFLGVVDADIYWGSPSDSNINTLCMYDYAAVSANKAELDKTSVYVNGNYQITDNMEFFSTALVSRVESFGRFAPPAAEWPDMPADYSDVPFDIDALLDAELITEEYELTGLYRWTNIGNRDNLVTDTQFDFTAGLRGDLTSNVSYEAYLQKSRYDVKELGYYYLSYTGLSYVVNEGIDPFTEEGAAAMSATTTQDNFSEMSKAYGHIQFGLGDWFGAGDVLALAGTEYIVLDYQNKYDRHSEAGLVGGSAGNSSEGERDIFAAFTEAVIPVTGDIEVNAALRYDSYDDFGSAVSPSLSATWNVAESVTLSGRVGQGFRAPGLDQLYGPLTFSAESASDQYTCALNNILPEDCTNAQYDTYYSTNPELDAESSDSLSLGVAWEALDNLLVDVTYWDITVDDVITQPLTQSIFYAEAAGFNFAPSSGTYVDRTGGRAVVYSSYVNQGELSASGLDFEINTWIDTGVGQFSTDLLVTYSLNYEQAAYFGGPIQETAGFNLHPELKGQWFIGWEMGPHEVDLVVDYVGPSSEQDFIAFDNSGNAFLDTSDTDLDSWTTINLSYSFDADNWGKITLGGRNITNEDPVLDRTGKYDVTHYDLYDNTGRVLYVEYGIDF